MNTIHSYRSLKTARSLNTRPRTGFTLVELLVVLVIIAILMSLISVAVLSGLTKARQTKITVEMSNLAMAIENYKIKFGAYPPSNAADLKEHVKKRFPRIDSASKTLVDKFQDTDSSQPYYMGPENILVFCLTNYSPDPKKPLSAEQTGDSSQPKSKEAFFAFDVTRISGTGTSRKYLPPEPASDANRAPYVYLCTSNSGSSNEKFEYPANSGTKVAYFEDSNSDGTYERRASENTYQLICGGLDGKLYGSNTQFTPPNPNIYKYNRMEPGGTPKYYYDPEEADNLSNFFTGALDDTKP